MSDMMKPQTHNMPLLAALLPAKSNQSDQQHDITERFQDTMSHKTETTLVPNIRQRVTKAHTGKPKTDGIAPHVRLMNDSHKKTPNHLSPDQRQNTDHLNSPHSMQADKTHDTRIVNLKTQNLDHHNFDAQNPHLFDDADILTDLDLSADSSWATQDKYDEKTYNPDFGNNITSQQAEHMFMQTHFIKGEYHDHTKIQHTDDHSGDMLFTDLDQDHDQIHEPHLNAKDTFFNRQQMQESETLTPTEQKLFDDFVNSQKHRAQTQNFETTLQDDQADISQNPDHIPVSMENNRISTHKTDTHQAGDTLPLQQANNKPDPISQNNVLTLEITDDEQGIHDDQNHLSKGPMNTFATEQNIAALKRSTIVPVQLELQTKGDESPAPFKHSMAFSQAVESIPSGQDNTENSMNFSQFSGMSSPFKDTMEQAKQVVHHLVSSNPAVEFIETLRQHFKNFGKNQIPRLTVNMRHGGKNLTIHFMADQQDQIHITFRTKDKEWEKLLIENRQMISDLFNAGDHTVNIKYLGEDK